MRKLLIFVWFSLILLASCSGDYRILWKTDMGEPVDHRLKLDEGKIYLSLKEGAVACLDAESGEVLWRTPVKGWLNTSPAVSDDVIYVGTSEGIIAALNKKSGEVLHEYHAGGIITSEITVNGSAIYFSHTEFSKETPGRFGILKAVDVDNWELLWRLTTGSKISSTPLVWNENVYVGSWDKNLYCLNKDTGEEQWRYETPAFVIGSALVYEDMLYTHSDDHCLYKFNPVTGDLIWSVESGYFYTPAIHEEDIYYTCKDGHLYVRNKEDGSLLWSYTLGSSITAKPVFSGETVFLVDILGKLTAVDLNNHQHKWSFNAKGEISAPPAVEAQCIYFGTDKGFVYSIDTHRQD